MLLNGLQAKLEEIYEIESPHRVHDFVIHDAVLAARLDTSDNARDLPEKLLIQQEGDDLALTLYLDEQTTRRLERHDPMAELNEGNIHAFWTVLEGVSHFVYLTYNAEYERPVSLFELELQAEVDKYILAAHLLRQQGGDWNPQSMHHHLYRQAAFDDRLQAHELRRYRLANELAGRFVAFIEYCFRRGMAGSRISNALRRFYRFTHHQKIRSIDRLHDWSRAAVSY
jgi:hypothetical protein